MVELNFHCIEMITVTEPRRLSLNNYVREIKLHLSTSKHPISLNLYSDSRNMDEISFVRDPES